MGETFEYYFEDEHGNVRSVEISEADRARRGECSGIPVCCVDAYVPGETATPSDWGYMPCGDCLARGNRVEVRDCAADNGARCTCGAWDNSVIVECGTEAVAAALDNLGRQLAIAAGLCRAFRAGFDAGFGVTGEGFNGKYAPRLTTARYLVMLDQVDADDWRPGCGREAP